ncbi:MAG: hypothetical protein A2096_09140 [Spirochaetes bacterium GWF1_41_5]|nr:MAG: hypothetical protein A2096_09140 [Spirochaetes bacterium GWF1_41_5]HBE03242.1 hypothetical protein [Spirochaetia bacterium]
MKSTVNLEAIKKSPFYELLQAINENTRFAVTQDPLFSFKPIDMKKNEFIHICDLCGFNVDVKLTLSKSFLLFIDFSKISSARCLLLTFKGFDPKSKTQQAFIFARANAFKIVKIKTSLKKDYADFIKGFQGALKQTKEAARAFRKLVHDKSKNKERTAEYVFKTNQSGNFSLGSFGGKAFLIQLGCKNDKFKLLIDDNDVIHIEYKEKSNLTTKKYRIACDLKHHWLKAVK